MRKPPRAAAILASIIVLGMVVGVMPASGTAPGGNGRLTWIAGVGTDYSLWVTETDLVAPYAVTDPGSLAYANGPSWSPDGRIVFGARRADAPEGRGPDLWIIDGDGTDLERLTSTRVWEGDAAWSPDGSTIAFARRGELFVIDAEGGGRRRLTFTPRSEGSPEWAPDGTRLVFVRQMPTTRDLYLIDVATLEIDPLLTTHAQEDAATWLPDGMSVAYTRTRDPGSGQLDSSIWMVEVATRNASPIFNDRVLDEHDAVVAPDGSRIAWVRTAPNLDPGLDPLSELMVSDLDGANPVVVDACGQHCAFSDLDWERV